MILGSHEADKHFMRVPEDWMGRSKRSHRWKPGTRHIVVLEPSPPQETTINGRLYRYFGQRTIRGEQSGKKMKRERQPADVRARLSH